MLNPLRLRRITSNSDLEDKTERIGRMSFPLVEKSPAAFTQLMVALDFTLGPSFEVVVAGNSKAEDIQGLLKYLQPHFIPNKVVLLHPTELESPDIVPIAEYRRDMSSIGGRATAYICSNFTCKTPTTDAVKMLDQLAVPKQAS